MLKTLKRWISFVSVIALFALVCVPATHAESFGGDAYGGCAYGAACAREDIAEKTPETSPQQQTIVGVPPALEVAINLSDGQVIPSGGYTIIVTPLNGQGSSFAKVDFYIDDTLAASSTPDETGTARWRWEPRVRSGTSVKTIITAQDGTTVTKIFRVVVAETGAATGHAAQRGSAVSGNTQSNGLERFIQALPPRVVTSVPYVLFVLLACNILVVLLLAYRELQTAHAERRRLAQSRQITEAKKTFIELISHYLRTPLTLLRGGIDMLKSGGIVAPPQLQTSADNLSQHIAGLIDHARNQLDAPKATMPAEIKPARLWLRPGLYVPLVLTAMFVTAFNLLVTRVGDFTLSQVTLATQVILYSLLAVLLYMAVRRLYTQRLNRRETQRLLASERAVEQAREEFVNDTMHHLQADLATLHRALDGLPDSKEAVFIRQAVQRFKNMLARFTIAAQLKGSRGTEPYKSVALTELVEQAKRLTPKIAAKQTQVRLDQTLQFKAQDPDLLAIVLASLLDNAAEYSEPNSKVIIDALTTDNEVRIQVADEGAGIPEDTMAMLFEPFSKAEGAETFNHEGMGFSLYLDRLILLYLGGDITVESKPGKGTVVTLSLPL